MIALLLYSGLRPAIAIPLGMLADIIVAKIMINALSGTL